MFGLDQLRNRTASSRQRRLATATHASSSDQFRLVVFAIYVDPKSAGRDAANLEAFRVIFGK
jgi:hypothetical protein